MEFETVTIPNLDSVLLSLNTYLAGSNPNGKMGKFTANELATFLAPYIASIGGSGFLPTTGFALPPAQNGKYTIVGPGTYTQSIGANVVVNQLLNILSSSASTWTLAQGIDLSSLTIKDWSAKVYTIDSQVFYKGNIYVANDSILAGDVPGVSLKWSLKIKPEYEYNSYQENNPALAASSAWNLAGFTGGVTVNNWVRMLKQPILPNTTYTLLITGTIPAGTPLAVFSDSSDIPIVSENIISNGSVPQQMTFVTGSSTRFIGINVVNRDGQGANPLLAPELGSMILLKGSVIKPFIKFGSVISTTFLDYDVKANDKKISDSLSEITIKSKNLINMLTEPVKGRYVAGTGQFTTSSTDNWLAIPRKIIDPSLIGKMVTISNTGQISAANDVVVIRDNVGNVVFEIPGLGAAQPSTFTFALQSGYYDWGFTVANVSSPPIGLSPKNNIFTEIYQVEEGAVATFPSIKDSTYINGKKIKNLTSLGYKESEVVITKTSGTALAVHYHSGAINDKWIKLEFIRAISSTNYYDTWKLNQGFIAKRIGEFTFLNEVKFITTGVWENAIGKGGYAYPGAFYGSTHGFEEMTNITIMLDEKVINPASAEEYWIGNRFEASQSSKIFKPDHIGVAFISTKNWVITDKVVTFENVLDTDLQTNLPWNSYFGMGSVLRKGDDLISQITTTAIPNDDMIRYDVSEPGFTTPIYYDTDALVGPSNTKRTSIILFGPRIKVKMTALVREVIRADGTVIAFGMPDRGMFVQNTPLYNKGYTPFGAVTAQNKDRIRVVMRYDISGQ